MFSYLDSLFSLSGLNILFVGGGGVLGAHIAPALAAAGARVWITSRTLEKAQGVATALNAEFTQKLGESYKGEVIGAELKDASNLTDIEALNLALTVQGVGKIDVLINGAGGNDPAATFGPTRSFFELASPTAADASRKVFGINYDSALLGTAVFGKKLMQSNDPSVINIGSMAGLKALSRVPIYSGAKAAVHSLTQYLSVELQDRNKYSKTIRVNALIPGFFLTKQNEGLLVKGEKLSEIDRIRLAPTPDDLTDRGRSVIGRTPMSRFGNPNELIGATVLLCSPTAASFINGAMLVVDGGFDNFTLG